DSGGGVVLFSSTRRHTSCYRDWSSDVCSSDLWTGQVPLAHRTHLELAQAISPPPDPVRAPRRFLLRLLETCLSPHLLSNPQFREIGRASCREIVKIPVIAAGSRSTTPTYRSER